MRPTVLYQSPLTHRVHVAKVLADLGNGRLALAIHHDDTTEVAHCAEPGDGFGKYRVDSVALELEGDEDCYPLGPVS